MGIKTSKFHLRFLYSQDLSNRTTGVVVITDWTAFLYSQDLSNRTTYADKAQNFVVFLYSQDLSNRTTESVDNI